MYSSDDEENKYPLDAYHVVVLDFHQVIKLFLTLESVDEVRMKFVHGVFALDAHMFGQVVSAGNADLQTLSDLTGKLVENADWPVGRGQAQPANFSQFHIVDRSLVDVGR